MPSSNRDPTQEVFELVSFIYISIFINFMIATANLRVLAGWVIDSTSRGSTGRFQVRSFKSTSWIYQKHVVSACKLPFIPALDGPSIEFDAVAPGRIVARIHFYYSRSCGRVIAAECLSRFIPDFFDPTEEVRIERVRGHSESSSFSPFSTFETARSQGSIRTR